MNGNESDRMRISVIHWAIFSTFILFIISGTAAADGVPYWPRPGVFFHYAIILTAVINVPINFIILVGPLLAMYGKDVRRNFSDLQEFIQKNIWYALGVSVLGAFIDFYVVFKADVQADYHWTYEPDLLRWGIGGSLIFLIFFIPVFFQMKRAYKPAIIVGNMAIIWNLVAWSMIPYLAIMFTELYDTFYHLIICCCSSMIIFLLIIVFIGINTSKRVRIWWRREDLREIRRLRRMRLPVPKRLKRHALRISKRNTHDLLNTTLILLLALLISIPFILHHLAEPGDVNSWWILFLCVLCVFPSIFIVNELHWMGERKLLRWDRLYDIHPEVKEACLLIVFTIILSMVFGLPFLIIWMSPTTCCFSTILLAPISIYIAHDIVQRYFR